MLKNNGNSLQPLILEGNIHENWRKWRQRFENYLVASELSSKKSEVQCATLLHFIGEECHEIYNTFNIEADKKNDIKVLLNTFEGYFNPKKNITYERHKFFTRNQSAKETVDQYVTELKSRASSCEFDFLKDSLIKDRLVCGIIDETVREKLLQESDLDLNKAIEICRAHETSRQQSRNISSGPSTQNAEEEEVINSLKKYKFGNKNNKCSAKIDFQKPQNFNINSKNKTFPKKHCTKCNTVHVFANCPAFGVKCYKCNKFNHYSKCCRSKNVHVIKETYSDTDSSDTVSENKFFIGSINYKNTNQVNEWHTNLNINNVDVKFKLDTGAPVNCISFKNSKKLNIEKLFQTKVKLLNYNGVPLNVAGTCNLTCNHKNENYNLEFFVIKDKVQSILGLKACKELQLIQKIDLIESQSNKNLLTNYQNVFKGIESINVKPVHIHLTDNVNPVVHPPRKIPFGIRNELKKELIRLEQNNIITKISEPTEWVNSMVVVRKTDGSIRICIDPKDLNKAIKREYFYLQTLQDIAPNLKGAVFFSKLDASQGFHQLKLDKASSLLCTFNTPFGRYRFLRLPFGIRSAPEIFHKMMKFIIEGLDGVDIYIDDFIVYGETKEQHDERLKQLLERLSKYNVKINKNKSQFCVNKLTYLGHVLSAKGLEINKNKITAITSMEKPSDKKSLQRFLGMITYVGRFINNLSETTHPLRILLKKNILWHWEKAQEDAYNKLLDSLREPPVLKFFDENKPALISVDASSTGVGAVLLQEGHPVAYASKSLTETQKGWAQIEKECFAVLFGCEHFYQYIFGKTVEVETDHKPLIPIFKKSLNNCPLRLQRMLIRLQQFDIKLKHKPGSKLYIADTLSRSCTSEIKINYLEINEIEAHVDILLKDLNISETQLKNFEKETLADQQLKTLNEYLLKGWPEKNKIDKSVKQYYPFRYEITRCGNILFKNDKIIVPNNLKHEMLNRLHYGHLGIEKCKYRARNSLFWPQLNTDIENYIKNCEICSTYMKIPRKEPMISHQVPNRAWEKVGADIFYFEGKNYLLIADYFSKYVEICLLKTMTSSEIITNLKSIFARHGIPKIFISDNAKQFVSKEFENFSKIWDFKHVTSSAYYPQSNGFAERNVQIVKNMLKKCTLDKKDPYLALLELRNTPVVNELSPAQLLMNRNLNGILPLPAKSKKINNDKIKQTLQNKQKISQKYYNRSAAKPLPDIQENSNVKIFNFEKRKWQKGTVLRKNLKPRSYKVKVNNKTIERNRRYITLQTFQTEEDEKSDIVTDEKDDIVTDEKDNIVTDEQNNLETDENIVNNIDNQDGEIPSVSDQPEAGSADNNNDNVFRTSSGRIVRPPAYLQDYQC